jgi:putative ABC transport system permease protein
MAIPLRYNLRNLILRKGATIMTTAGIALTVTVAILIVALLTGLRKSLAGTGDPLTVIVLPKGADSESAMGGMSRDVVSIIEQLPGISKDIYGRSLVSGEDIRVIVLSRGDGTGLANVAVRFLSGVGMEMRPMVKIVRGRWFTTGQPEVVVSGSISKRFREANIGESIWIGNGTWKVVGVFDSAGTAHDSEIWADVNQVGERDRATYSSVFVRAIDPVSADALIRYVSNDQRLKLKGMLESDYYARQSGSGAPIKLVGVIVGILMAIGSCFAGLNTMYAAISYRSREIATLRVIGFSRSSILVSFLCESLLLSLGGAIISTVLILPFNGLTMGTINSVTHTESVFRLSLTPAVLAAGGLCALSLGVLGGLAPAWHASRLEIVFGLRDLTLQ